MMMLNKTGPRWLKEAELARQNDTLIARNRQLVQEIRSARSERFGDLVAAIAAGFSFGVILTLAAVCF